MASEPQSLAQALHLLQSGLRLRPNQRNVLGMASEAPSGQMYLQYGRSVKMASPRMVSTKSP